MKLIDFDGLFDEKLTEYMEDNKNKYTEKQWEDVIPRLYKKFGDTRIAKIGCTPKEYYAKMSDTELSSVLCQHLEQDVPVPEFLCAEIETRGEVEMLLPLLSGDNAQAAVYAVNLIRDDARAYGAYFQILTGERFDGDIRDDITEIFKLHADEIKTQALAALEEGKGKEYMLEILSRVKNKEDAVYEVLLAAFKTDENLPMRASYLASYGDERALPILLKRIEDKTIGFVEFQELKYAIEALGGEYDEVRDFSDDKDYLAVEVATQKAASNKDTSILA